MRKLLVVGTVAGFVAAGLCGVAAQPSEPPLRPAGQGQDMAGLLIQGLENTPGCLGVDAGRFKSGKQAICAWFENKAAVVAWYNSPVHRQLSARFAGGEGAGKPLEHVTDEETPILVIATITPSDRPAVEGMMLPISQISIELYAPLPGGAFVNGRLAPDGFKVPHMQDYTPPKVDEPREPEEQP